MAKHVRWYVNVGKWKPTKDEWLHLTACISGEEVERINKYHYQDDLKSSLIGRTLISKFVSQAIKRPSNELELTRTAYGRPVVDNEYKRKLGTSWPPLLDFNVSHSGNHCVLAGVWAYEDRLDMTVGVDVTKIVRKQTRQELDRFLDLMSRREFLPQEWETVEQVEDERQKCVNFTRLWCLKESYIKSIGLGLTFKLNRICFKPDSRTKFDLSTKALINTIIDHTKVELDGKLACDWRFFETALDEDHLVAVAYNLRSGHIPTSGDIIDEGAFVEINVSSLVEELIPIDRPCEANWIKYSNASIR